MVKMKTAEKIIDYAFKLRKGFSRADILTEFATCSAEKDKIAMQLSRLTARGKLVRKTCGVYSLPRTTKPLFCYHPSLLVVELAKQIKEKFPFIDFCIWETSALTQFMHHVPSANIIFIDVERVAMDAVFSFVQNLENGISVLLNPNKLECDRYITTNNIIIRALVKEAPITDTDNCPVPTLEKMLVDVAGDKELIYMQGAEIYNIYRNAFEIYNVNRNSLLRYAARRNRKDSITKILKTENL